jgi:flagellar motor switch protein FliG
MALKIDGLAQALELLQGLNPDEQKRILSDISKQNPEMAQLLEGRMISINLLQYITPKMLVDFLKEINVEDLGKALRMADQTTRDHLLGILPSRLGEQIKDVLNGPLLPLEKVQECCFKVTSKMKELMDQGSLVLTDSGEIIE